MVKSNDNIHYRCENSYCRGCILKHIRGNVWECGNCGMLYPIKTTLENYGMITANQLHKVKKKQPITIEDLDDDQFKKLVKKWKKKNL